MFIDKEKSEMSKRRVVITGLGAVTPLGNNVQELWANLLQGKNGVGPITRFDAGAFTTRIAAEVKDFDPMPWLDAKEASRMDRCTQFGIVAAEQALQDAGVKPRVQPGEQGNADAEVILDRARVGVIIGSGIGGLETTAANCQTLFTRGPHNVSPLMIPRMIPNITSGIVAIRYGFRGPNYCTVSACASANHSIIGAVHSIVLSEADMVITGGTEAAIIPLGVAGFAKMRALSRRNDEPARASRPFDRERDGFIMGEGAGILVLEELEHALARKANIYAEVLGVGMSADAYDLTAPDPDGVGAWLAMIRALNSGDISLEEVDYINAHGTSTSLNDPIETRAIKRLFGARAHDIPVSSTKSMIGHLLGAAGGVELIATALSVAQGMIHPTRNYEFPDDDCDLDYVPEGARQHPIRVALSNAFGFGGHNATIAVGAYRQ